MNTLVTVGKADPSLETVVVASFHNEEHKKWHNIFLSHGMGFMVVGGKIGLTYTHTKGVTITLEESEEPPPAEFYDAKIMVRREKGGKMETIIPLEDYYTAIEWRWAVMSAQSGFDGISRELHIILNVRPNSMNAVAERVT